MDASTTGQKASTRKPKPDRYAGARRARVVQALFMQAGLAALLLVMAAFSWRDREALLLFGVTLLIPLGWGLAFWKAYKRDQTTRDAGMWTPATDKAERQRTFATIGILFAVWIILAGAIVVLL